MAKGLGSECVDDHAVIASQAYNGVGVAAIANDHASSARSEAGDIARLRQVRDPMHHAVSSIPAYRVRRRWIRSSIVEAEPVLARTSV